MALPSATYPLSCVFGCILQQFSLYKESVLYKIPLTQPCTDKSCFLRLCFWLGLAFEVFSLKGMTLMQFLIISCTHLLGFKWVYAKDHELSFVQVEKLSYLMVGFAGLCALIVPVQPFETGEVLIDYFVMYQVCGVTILIVMRKLGFFSRKIWFEVLIPTQLIVGVIAGTKIALEQNQLTFESEELKSLIFPVILSAAISIGLASSFLKVILRHNDLIVVYGVFQIEMLILGSGICFFLQFEKRDFWMTVEFAAAVVAGCGNALMATQRSEYLKVVNEKRIGSGIKMEEEGEDSQEGEDPQNLELHIDEENLMDAEIIDEDLLIKTIRNI